MQGENGGVAVANQAAWNGREGGQNGWAVPISRALRACPDSYTPRPSLGDWHFPSPKGSRYDVDDFSQALPAANQNAGLSWTCLDYRHTFGSQLAMKGESLYKIAALTGNSPEVCRRHYAALLPEALSTSVQFSAPTLPESNGMCHCSTFTNMCKNSSPEFHPQY